MVEVIQADRDAAKNVMKRILCDQSGFSVYYGDLLQAFAAHRLAARADLLAELSEPTEAMLNACIGNNGIGPLTAGTVWRAMIAKAGE
jgi:hypothetical protein